MAWGSVEAEPSRSAGVLPVMVLAARAGLLEERRDWLAVEAALEIRARGLAEDAAAVAVTMRTPGRDGELAVGFLYTEGLIHSRDDLTVAFQNAALRESAQDACMIDVTLSRSFKPNWVARHFRATSSCGACGKATLDELSVGCRPLISDLILDPSVLISLPDALRRSQSAFEQTGGLHAAGLFDAQGRLLISREDVGRHNAVDKLVGRMLLENRLPLEHVVLMVSGRVSFEILQKAAMAGAAVVCAVSAPSSLAVQAAQRLGVTLIGFLRGPNFNVYAHPERLDDATCARLDSRGTI